MDLYAFSILALVTIGVVIGRWTKRSEIEGLREDIGSLEDQNKLVTSDLAVAQDKIGDLEPRLSRITALFDQTLRNLRKDSVLLPSLARWAEFIQSEYDLFLENQLRFKTRPAVKAAQEVKIARKKARVAQRELQILWSRLELYESLAPWLDRFVDLGVQELLDALREDRDSERREDEDPVSKFVTKAEWSSMPITERNQLALDRYLDPKRKRSLWRIGIDYERFVGYEYEKAGYRVTYHGATQGKADLGIDLICSKDREILIVQCKRLSAIKQIPVRENVIAQVFGAAEFYRINQGFQQSLAGLQIQVKPVLVTSYVLSNEARQFAKHLGVEVIEQHELSAYPMVKCNIARSSGEKIYHLPMDQQYDSVIIGDNPGEFYALTVKEAEEEGFRRAWRWKGN